VDLDAALAAKAGRNTPRAGTSVTGPNGHEVQSPAPPPRAFRGAWWRATVGAMRAIRTLDARAWRRFYAAERAALGDAGLARLLDEADAAAPPALDARRAWIFPHTRLSASGRLPAAVALATVRARVDEIVALGVLHGARAEDAALVARARGGDAPARAQLRRVHDEHAPQVDDEFSLDGFLALLAAAAAREGVAPPRVRRRFPFLVGARVDDLPGFDALAAARARGVPFVATCDPIHHGVGYGTPPEALRPREAEETFRWAAGRIGGQVAALSRGEVDDFLARCAEDRSDFRDVGPVLAALFQDGASAIEDLALVEYADVLEAPAPTWVAGARAWLGAA
jgi:hypothetical protein